MLGTRTFQAGGQSGPYSGIPLYSPELNPAEQIWNILRHDYSANHVFDSWYAATEQAELGLSEMAANTLAI
jgi:hypothetical protein